MKALSKRRALCLLLFAGALTVGNAVAQDNGDIIPVIPTAETAQPITQAFQIDRSERMTVPVRINGSEPIPFIVDTGAERTVIANDLARRLKLEAGPQLKLATITGPATAESFVIETLAMNTINVEMIEAPGLERQHLGAAGLLGIDSLEDHRVLLDFSAKKMDVQASPRKSRPGKAETGMIIVTATRRAGRMILSNATVGGIKVDIILDTGAQSSMGNYALRDRMRSRDRRFGYVPVIMNSVTGDKLTGDFTQIRNITIGGVNITDLPVTFADNYAFKALNLEKKPAILLGMDAMSLFDRVMIDFTNRRVGFDMPRGAVARNPVRLALAN